MFAINEQFSKLSSNGFENILRAAQISLDSSERLIKQQFELSKQALEGNVQIAQELAGIKDPQQALNQLNKVFSQSFEQAVKSSRSLYDIVSQTQSEFSTLTEESLDRLNKSFLSSFDTLSQNSPAGADAAINAFKSSFAAAAATISSLSRAAQQVAEFADTSVKAATSATAGAAKAPAKRGAAAQA
ncbi:MAG: phasin family protein [Paludibacterium sp.]|uniref:phasin family protein n=1 Tax=Paludibacterium sp. TaxID=1917523 RepID=UPI0025E00764|nr:phasin family protein [Paludibacterium sp.]MBV8048035.1 phasin family protein [Paludibacterium sp.]MBV8647559.1 phasin family protein [Paludibacterium sp.]